MRALQSIESDRKARREKIFEMSRYFHLRDVETVRPEDVFAEKDANNDTVEDIDPRFASLIMT